MKIIVAALQNNHTCTVYSLTSQFKVCSVHTETMEKYSQHLEEVYQRHILNVCIIDVVSWTGIPYKRETSSQMDVLVNPD